MKEEFIKVRLSDDFDREKLSISSRSWVDNNNPEHPRNGLIYKHKDGEKAEYSVKKTDRVIQHFLSGGTLVRVNSEEGKTDMEKLCDLKWIGEERAEEILQDNGSYEEFAEREDLIEYLSGLEGIGHSRAEEIAKEVK